MTFDVESAEDIQDILHGRGSFQIRGLDTKQMFPPESVADNVIQTKRMSGIIEWSPDDLVVVAKAGTAVEELNIELETKNQMLGVPTHTTPIGALTAGLPGTLGGLVSANLPTRWESKCRNPRYWVLGLTFVKADRTIIKCGSKAVKNVAGYDVQKLLIGSWGALGVITEVVLRTQPLARFDDEPKTAWDPSQPFCIARTLPSEIDAFIGANQLLNPIIDRATGTVWAGARGRVGEAVGGWVINSGFGVAAGGANRDLGRGIKELLDPLNRINPGRMG